MLAVGAHTFSLNSDLNLDLNSGLKSEPCEASNRLGWTRFGGLPPPLNLHVPHQVKTNNGTYNTSSPEVERRATFDKELGDLVADLSQHIATPLAGSARKHARSESGSDLLVRA